MDDPKGIRSLGRDGVLRRLNGARDTVLDYVQLSARHLEEFTKRFPPEAREIWAGVDGRSVISDAQLWAVPDDIVKRSPEALMSKPKERSLLEERDPRCRAFTCEDDDECKKKHSCAACDEIYECFGGPTGCVRSGRCDDTL
jgi:hypothetical protein